MTDEQLRELAHEMAEKKYEELRKEHTLELMLGAAAKAKQQRMDYEAKKAKEAARQTAVTFMPRRMTPAWRNGLAIAAACALVATGSLLALGSGRLPYQSIALPQTQGVFRGDEIAQPDAQVLVEQFGWAADWKLEPLQLVEQAVYPAATVSSTEAVEMLIAQYEGTNAQATLTISEGKLLEVETLSTGKSIKLKGQAVYWNHDPENDSRCAVWQQNGLQYSFAATGLTDRQLKQTVSVIIAYATH